jgi:hypothetical protein
MIHPVSIINLTGRGEKVTFKNYNPLLTTKTVANTSGSWEVISRKHLLLVKKSNWILR